MIEHQNADLGGTSILPPLDKAVTQFNCGNKQKRIFLLTDGEVDSNER